MEKIIRNQYKKSLSIEDLKKGAEGRVNVWLYEQLKNVHDIDQLFEPYGCCIILYQSSPNYGHWVALLKRKNFIEHFDPYGYKIDDELRISNPMKLKPYLSNLILNSKYERVVSNIGKFQSKKAGTNTCGRWAIVRCLMKNLSLDKFTDLFHNQHLDPDFYVTALTMFI